ncbi:M12 family metallopeptidase [Piscinibacter sp.]|uniref:M12 family metallopeptidase n=1 Tax=Piscinibacter sp. TaxID=1903157 RepID=UPI0039E41551
MSAPASRTCLWQPLGPHTLLNGEVLGAGRISGAVNALAVHPDGERLYAATANGGVWYSGDGGASWRSLDAFEPTPAPQTIDRPASRFACGAIAVDFGTASDSVYVGTGEPWHDPAAPRAQHIGAAPGQPIGGVGIFVGTHTLASGSLTWTHEAAGLLGASVYRFALEPGTGTRVVAATSSGLYERPSTDAAAAWQRVAGAPFDTLDAICTDLLWTPAIGTLPKRWWVWVESGASTGLWMRASNAAGADWRRIAAPGALARRAVLAAAGSQQIWLFCDQPGAATSVAGAPGGATLPRSARPPAAAAPPAALPQDDCDCWFRSSPRKQQGFVRLIESGEVKALDCNQIGGRTIFEGDIDLGPAAEMERMRQAAARPGGAPFGIAITGERYRWPGGVVPWETTTALRPLVESAIAHWEARTRIRFVERTPANAAVCPNWISFEALAGCYSPVGMQGGKQVISLGTGCGFAQAVHEIGHSLGLWHEQSREDRDNFVRVLTQNIKSGEEHNFEQQISDGDDIGAYDFGSIMHYSRRAFSKDATRLDTIVPIGGQAIGQRVGLSAGDVAAINAIYPELMRPLLFRIDAPADPAAEPIAVPVTGVPDVLGDSGSYAIALAVDPSRPDHVVIAGGRRAGADDDAALTLAPVAAGAGGTLAFGRAAPLGGGVHAHVHHVVFSNAGQRLWAASDGGVYRSDRIGAPSGFVAMNDGLAVVETNYVANHPVCEGMVLAGVHRHGVARRLSGAAWRREGELRAQGGGMAFDPNQPSRHLYQLHHGEWASSQGAITLPLALGENRAGRSAELSQPAMTAKQRPGAPAGRQTVTQTIVGTSRLWYSEDFGATWVTLPGATAPPAGNLAHDDFGRRITVCRWQGSEVAWVLGEGRLRRYARTAGSDAAAGPGTWTAQTLIERGVKQKKDETKANGPIRDAAAWTDIAVNLEPPAAPGGEPVARGTRGALYLGTVGKPGAEDVDTLWWFDGGERWFATKLRASVSAPVTAITCDPAFPDEVYVGTTIGVWKGQRNLADPSKPAWTWSARLNGLPEAVVQDLALYSHDGLRLLRAGLAARGVWELRLDTDDVADLAYLRAHADDLRHRAAASLTGRDGVTRRSWHSSPDLRPRRAAIAATTPATLPWTMGSPLIDTEPLRRFQSALRARTGDTRVRATGKWDSSFNEVLATLGAPTVLGTVRIDKAYWEQSMQLPWALAEPWGTARPASADLIEFGPTLREPSGDDPAGELPPGPSKVEVLVQYRGLAPLDGAKLRVALLKWSGAALPTGDAPWTAAINQVLNSTAGTSALPLGAGWSLVGGRQTLGGQTLDALRPGIASFDLDLSAEAAGRIVLLVAAIHGGDADVALAPAPLAELVANNAHLAARSLRVAGGTVADSAVRNPFPTVPYALELAPGAAHNTRLAAALATQRAALRGANQTQLDALALLIAKLTPAGTMEYAGVHETEMYFSASLLKVAMLYASFELLAQVNQLAPALTAPGAAKFLERVRREFGTTIERSVARIKPGAWRSVKFGEVLRALPDGPNRFRVEMHPTHAQDVEKIFSKQDQNLTPRDTMHRLGYSYVNRALEAGGFFDATSASGIWTTADYGAWPDFHVPVATRGGKPPRNGTSSAAMTALAMASLLAHLHRGTLVDAAASQRMRTIFEAGAGWTWLKDHTATAASSFDVTGCKIGEASSGSAFVGTVFSEGAWLRRRSDAAPFVVVWQNAHLALPFEPIAGVIDEVVRTWP